MHLRRSEILITSFFQKQETQGMNQHFLALITCHTALVGVVGNADGIRHQKEIDMGPVMVSFHRKILFFLLLKKNRT